MHENIKYTVRLTDKIVSYNNRTSLRTRNNDLVSQIKNWQSIFADVSYNTHYHIYAKFIGKRGKKEGFDLNKIQLYIQNYTGMISIGYNGYYKFKLSKIEDPADEDYREKNITGRYRQRVVLTIGTEAFQIENQIISDSKYCKNKTIYEGDVLTTDVIFTPANPDLSKIYNKDNFHESEFVDEKFMERSGDQVRISVSGEAKLRDLEMRGIISELDLKNAGINKNSDESNNKLNLFYDIERKGFKVKCKPINTYFTIE